MTAPGPSGAEMLRQLRAIQRAPHEFLLRCARTYGGVVQLPIGNRPVYAVSDPTGVRHVLQDNAHNYTKDTIQFNTLALVTGQGLLTSDGEDWLRQRRMMQPAFHRQRVAAFGQIMVGATEQMLARWDALPAGVTLDVDHEMMKLTLEIVGRTLFSIDLSTAASDLVQAVLIALDYVVYRAQTPLALPPIMPTPRNRAFRRALQLLDEAVYRLIAARRREAAHPGNNDLLDLLLAARTEDGQPMSDRQLRDEIITLIIAGHETVASALTWTWHLLATHPTTNAIFAAELAQQLNGRQPTVADLPALPYTRAVFDEALRLYPPAWLITRKARAADKIAGCLVPAGALIIISPYVIHHDDSLWPDAEAFRPERFLGVERGRTSPDALRSSVPAFAATPRFAYLPFGGGPRLCIGNTFALVEGALTLATVAQRYRLLAEPGRVVQVEPLVTLRPKGGLHLRLERTGG